MKIITWNCCLPPWVFDHRKRRILIALEIIVLNPDIICLQEVFFKKDADFLKQQFQKNSFNYHFYFKNLLISSKAPIIKQEGFVFKNQGSIFSSAFFDVIYRKGFQRVLLDNNTCIINAHLLSGCGSVKENVQKVRQKQAEEIYQRIDNEKAIILGDFNFIPSSKPFKQLIKHNLKECFNEDIRTRGDKKLDHIFIKNVEYIHKEVIFEDYKYSDHKGLLIEI